MMFILMIMIVIVTVIVILIVIVIVLVLVIVIVTLIVLVLVIPSRWIEPALRLQGRHSRRAQQRAEDSEDRNLLVIVTLIAIV